MFSKFAHPEPVAVGALEFRLTLVFSEPTLIPPPTAAWPDGQLMAGPVSLLDAARTAGPWLTE